MERKVIYDFGARENGNVASALLEFEPESAGSDLAAASVDRVPSPTRPRGIPQNSWPNADFFSETIESFDAEKPAVSPAGAAARRGGREAQELFAEISAAHGSNWRRVVMGAVALAVVVGIGVPASRRKLAPATLPVRTGRLVIVTTPPGVAVVIDGTPSGVTPLNQRLIAGPHTVELRGAGPSRTIGVTVTAGGRALQYVELPDATPEVGHLELRRASPGALVTVADVAEASANHRP
jgi:hypothetical protein